MIKQIKSDNKYGENCGIAKQVQGQIVDATQDKYGLWHFKLKEESWVASDDAFEEGDKMRDINRIYKFCNKLAEIWVTQCPDMRFGQMICNVIGDYQSKNKKDIFFIEEEEMMQIFRDYFKVDK